MRSPSIRSISILLLLLVCGGTASSLTAQTASSSAFGAGAAVSVQPTIGLQVSAAVGPIPSVAGTAPPSYGNDRSAASAGLSTVLTGPILGTGVLTVHADGQTTGAPAAQSSATVNGVGVSLPLLLGLTADTVQSTAAVRVVNGAVAPSGSTILTNPKLTGLLGTGVAISATPDPNTVVLDALGIRLVLNEQIISNGGTSIEVNAIHLTLVNVVLTGIGRISGDVTVAHSEASLGNLAAQLSVSQSASPSTVVTGGRTTYDVVLHNAGPLTANVVAVTDVLPPTFTFVSSPSGTPSVSGSSVTFADGFVIPPGEMRTISILAQAGNTTGTFLSTATVTGTNFPPATTGPSAPVTVVAPVLNGSVDGTVRDGVTGAAIAGATVTLRDGNGQIAGTATTDGAGHYAVPNLPPGSYTATFSASGYSPATVPVTIPSGGAAHVDGSLQPLPGVVQGTVVDGNSGQPVPGAIVTVTYNGTTVTTTTDPAGHFQVRNVPAEVPVTVTVQHPDYGPLPPITVTLPPGGTDDRNVTLAPLPGTIVGTVTDSATHAPLGGVAVELLRNGAIVAAATTDGAGHYTLSGVATGSYDVRFRAIGYTTVTVPVTVAPNQTQTLDVALTAAGNPAAKGNLHGTIRDASTSAPIAGATAELISNGSVVATVLADGAGQYSFDGIDAGSYSVRFSAAGYVPATLATTVSAGQTRTLNASLTPAQAPATTGTLSGTVTDAANGHPIAGAAVEILSGGNVVAATTTDAGGHYAFANVDPGNHPVRFGASGYDPATLSARITAGQNTTLDAALTAAAPPVTTGTLSGTVTDAANGHPIAGAAVELLRNGSVVASTTSGASGSYSFPAVDAGAYDVRFTATGYQAATLSASIAAGQTTTLNAALVPTAAPAGSGALTGTVTDAATAAPLGGATVQVLRNGSVVAVTATDAAGRYSFADLGAGDVTVRFSATGYVTLTRDTSIPAGGTQTVDAALARAANGDPTGSVTGTITDALSGAAIAGATVTLDEGGRTRSTSSDAAGRYAFSDVRSGVALQVSAAAGAHRPASSASFSLAANATATIDLALEPMPGAIRGTVTSAPNAPLADVIVQLSDDRGRVVATTQSDAGGHYSFPSLAPGSWTLRFTRDGYVPATELASVTSNTTVVVDAQLAPLSGSVSGTVRDAVTGDALAGAIVTLTVNGTTRTDTTNSAGEYAFAAVDANAPATLQAKHAGYVDGDVSSFTLPPNGSLRRDLSLQPKRGSIGGTVTTAGGAALSGVSVTLTGSAGATLATATTDASGRYLFEALLPGRYSLAFSKSGYSSATATASVLADQRTTVDQTLLAPDAGGGTSIGGVVRDARSGAPIPGAAITLAQGGTTRTTTSDPLGNFVFADVTAGVAATLSASRDDYVPLTTSPFTPAAGAAERHDLVLQPQGGSIGGTVTSAASHAPIANAAVELQDAGGNLLASTTTDSSGAYLFADVEAGSYRLRFRASGYRDSLALATVAANRRTIVDAQLATDDGSGQPAGPDGCANAAPILSVPAAIALDANGRARFFAVATDPDGVTVRARNLPACAAFDASTGLFTMNGSADCWKESTQQVITFDAVDSRGAKTSAPVLLVNAGSALRSRRRAVGGGEVSPAIRISRPPQPVVASVGDWIDIPIAAASDDAGCAVHLDVVSLASTSFDAVRGTLSFAPSASDPSLSDVLILATDCHGNTATSHFTLLVRHDGDAGRVAVAASDLQFGEVGAGTLSEPITLLVRNVGGANLDMTAVQSDDPRFLVTGVNGLPAVLRPGREVAVVIRFQPTRIGSAGATLTIATSDASQPLVRVHLGGMGVPQLSQPLAGNAAPAAAVMLSVPGPQLVEHGRTLRFAVGAVAAAGGDVTVDAGELPEGATFANGIFTFTPTDACTNASPLHVVTFTASAADGTSTTASVSIRVVDPSPASAGRAPVISVPADLLVVAPGARMALPLRALPQSTDCAVTFAMEMPDTVSFDSATGMVTFAPNAADLGRIATVIVHATDCSGRTSTEAFEVATGYGSLFVRSSGLQTAQQIGLGNGSTGGGLILSVVNGDDQPHVITNAGFEDGRSLLLEDGLSLPLTLAPGRRLPIRVERMGNAAVADRLVITTKDPAAAVVTTVSP